MYIRPASEPDAPDMGRLMVETYLRAHKGQIPEEVWQRRKEEWTWEVSAKAWQRVLLDIDSGASPKDCIYLAVNEDAGLDQIAGLVMGGPADVGPWEKAGEIYTLYVHHEYQRCGAGRELVRAATRHLSKLGMNRLVIRSLPANTPANLFYEALGGQVVGKWESEEYEQRIPERIYGWMDSSQLLKG